MKWMIEEAKLGQDQREIIEEVGKVNGRPIWIQGHAGSGKSVVLLHALSDYLIRNKNSKVVVVVFTHALVDLIKTGLKQIPALNGRNIPVLTLYKLKRNLDSGATYDAIFCDEVQDLPLSFIEKMKAASKQLIIAGDSAQSIYGSVPTFNASPATKEQIGAKIAPIEKKSTTIYRLTKSVLNVLKNVFADLVKDKTYSGKEDSIIRLFESTDRAKEIPLCWDECELINTTRPSEINAILIYKKDDIVYFVNEALKHRGKNSWDIEMVRKFDSEEYDFHSMNSHLDKEGLPLMYVGSNYGSLEKADERNKIVIMTYHSAKGLDFDAVCLPFIDVDLGRTTNENALILVALSRAKRDLFVSYSGAMYSGFRRFLKDLNPMISSVSKSDSEEILF
ncbi:MAG: superfamily I DNA/RNA helicase [Psychroserpens sp.]|jgi:superfamily I DNA/RNA helicase